MLEFHVHTTTQLSGVHNSASSINNAPVMLYSHYGRIGIRTRGSKPHMKQDQRLKQKGYSHKVIVKHKFYINRVIE